MCEKGLGRTVNSLARGCEGVCGESHSITSPGQSVVGHDGWTHKHKQTQRENCK